MDFLILRPLPPKTGYHFLGGGGVKSFRSEGSKQWGSKSPSANRWSNLNAADANFSVGGSNLGLLTFRGGGGGAKYSQPGFEPPTKETSVGCVTIRPLHGLQGSVAPLFRDAFATDKKPKLCVSV